MVGLKVGVESRVWKRKSSIRKELNLEEQPLTSLEELVETWLIISDDSRTLQRELLQRCSTGRVQSIWISDHRNLGNSQGTRRRFQSECSILSPLSGFDIEVSINDLRNLKITRWRINSNPQHGFSKHVEKQSGETKVDSRSCVRIGTKFVVLTEEGTWLEGGG